MAVGLAGPAGDGGPLRRVQATTHTDVTFRTLDRDLITWYVGTGEALDKAGAYGIQGRGALLVERITGSYLNVVGLPVTTLDTLCRSLGWPLHRLADEPVTAPTLDAEAGVGA